MTTANQIGLTLYGVAGVPATNDDAGFEALTFVQLKGTQMLPKFGVTHSNIDVSDLGTAQSGLYSLKIVRGSGTDSGDGPAPVAGDVVQYAQGYLHTYDLNEKDDSSFEGGTISFKQNDFTVDDAEPA